MAQLQYQEQEDLLVGHETAAHSRRKFSIRDIRSRKSYGSGGSKKGVRTQNLKPSIFNRQIKFREASQKLTNVKGESIEPAERKTSTPKEGNVLCSVIGFENDFEDFSEHVVHSAVGAYNFLKEIMIATPKYQEEFKLITSIALLLYGGSWTRLAGIIAALEAFGTKDVLKEAYQLGKSLVFDDSEGIEVTANQVKRSFRDLASHTALLVAVTVTPSLSEICLSIAFATKYTSLVQEQGILRKFISRSVNLGRTEADHCFSSVDTSWIDFIGVLACNILSLIIFGCFPQFATAMFMGYLGVFLLMDFIKVILNMAVLGEFLVVIDEGFWMKKSTQYYAWGIVVVMAIWQAVSEYKGVCLSLSWLMFLYPLVKLYNLLS